MLSGNYRVFCMFVSQKYISPDENDPLKKFTKDFWRKGDKKKFKRPTLSKEDQDLLSKVRDDMIQDMKRIPPHLFLVLR